MDNQVASQQVPSKQPRSARRSLRAIVIAFILGLLTWLLLGKINEQRPLYEMHWESKLSILSQMQGPYLVVHYQTESGRTNEEYRNLSDGKLVFELKDQVLANSMAYLPALDKDHPEGLVTYRYENRGTESVNWIQPQLRQQSTLSSFGHDQLWIRFSDSREIYAEVRLLPVTPFSLLHGNGLGDTLASQLQYYLYKDETASPDYVAFISVFATRTGQRLSSCSLPAFGSHYYFYLMDDGEHVLLPPIKPVSELVSKYRLSQLTTQDMSEPASYHLRGMKLVNCRTGEIERDWLDTSIVFSVSHVDREHLLMQSIKLNLKQYWSDSWPDNDYRYWILNWRNGERVDLDIPSTARSAYPQVADDGFQLLYDEDTSSQLDIPHYTWQLCRMTGEVVESSSFALSRDYTLILCPHLNQIILYETLAPSSLQELLLKWSERFAWLKHFVNGPKSSASLWDIATGQRVLTVAMDRHETFQASKDGKHLLVVTKQGEDPKRYHARVYALPLVPPSWWMKWLPTVAGCVLAAIVWRLMRGRQVRLS